MEKVGAQGPIIYFPDTSIRIACGFSTQLYPFLPACPHHENIWCWLSYIQIPGTLGYVTLGFHCFGFLPLLEKHLSIRYLCLPHDLFPKEPDMHAFLCVHLCMCVVHVCMHAHICIGWREGLREGCLLSYAVFFHIQMTLIKSTSSTKTFSYPHQPKWTQPPSRITLKFPSAATFPDCLLMSAHAQKVLTVVGSEHHPISSSFWEGSGRISFKSSLCSTSSKGHAS